MDRDFLKIIQAPGGAGCRAPDSGADRVIVEFLGVSGSGKSTLAQALAARFEQQGYRTQLLTMQRPTALGRVLGALYKAGNLCRAALSRRDQLINARYLLGLFPQKNLLHHARVMQYILHMFSLRSKISRDCQIVILDQGFAQAIYSLALFSQLREDHELDAAFSSVPEPDVVVSLNLPAEIVAKRLKERRGLAGVARVTASDSNILRRSFRLITRIEGILKASGCPVIRYCPGNAVSVERSTDELFRALCPVVSEATSARGLAAVDQRRRRSPQHSEVGMTLHHRGTAAGPTAPYSKGLGRGAAAVQLFRRLRRSF